VQAGANVDRIRWVNRTITFLHVLDLALLVHNKGGATSKLGLLIEDPVCFRNLTGHVTEKRKFHSDFFGERGVGRRSINADAEHRGVLGVDLARVNTSLVCLQFFGSTTGEGKHVECQDDVLLAAIVAQLYRRALITA
jgi:hypothetical protein